MMTTGHVKGITMQMKIDCRQCECWLAGGEVYIGAHTWALDLTRLNVVFVEDQTDTQQHCHYLPLPHTQEATYLIQIFCQFQPVSAAAAFKTQNWTLCECKGWRSRTKLVWGTERERSRESEAGWSCQSCLLAIGCCCLTHWCERWECCCCCAATMADICCQQIAWKSEIFQDFNLCVDYDIRIWAL